MKKLLFPLMALVLALGLALPMATPALAMETSSIAPTGTGNFDQWTLGAGASKVAAVAGDDGDTSYIWSSTVGNRQTFSFPGAGVPAGYTIDSVKVTVVPKKTSGSPTIKIVAEKGTNPADISDGDDSWSVGGSYVSKTRTMETNPFTGAPWTLGEVNSWTMNFGVKLESSSTVLVTQIYVIVEYSVSAPSLTSPADTAVVTSPVTLTWSSVTVPTPPATYQVQVASDSGFSSVVYASGWLTGTTDTTPALADGTYYWRARARDSTPPPPETSAWSSPWSFTVASLTPEIAVEKYGPPWEPPGPLPDTIPGYFVGTEVTYHYYVTNPGDIPLSDVTLSDDPAGTPSPVDVDEDGYNDGDLNEDGYLDLDETWQYTVDYVLECDGLHYRELVNTVTATGYYGPGVDDYVEAQDTWKVMIFQWQPRTIGYWGNAVHAHHYTDTEFDALVSALLDAGIPNIEQLASDYGWDSPYADDIHDFLLGAPPMDPGDDPVAYAKFLMEKQYLAAWFNVASWVDWSEEYDIPDFTGYADTSMDPYATVYLSRVDGAVELFDDNETLEVWEVLLYIEGNKDGWGVDELGVAQEVLDKMNNAENNGYLMFMDPAFDPTDP